MSDPYVPDTWSETWVPLSPKISFYTAEIYAQLFRCINTKRNTMASATPGYFSKYTVEQAYLFQTDLQDTDTRWFPDGTNKECIKSQKNVVDIGDELYWYFLKTCDSLLVSQEVDEEIYVWASGTEDNYEKVSGLTEALQSIKEKGPSYFEKPVHWKEIIEALRVFLGILDARVLVENFGVINGSGFVSGWRKPLKTVPENKMHISIRNGDHFASTLSSEYRSLGNFRWDIPQRFRNADYYYGTPTEPWLLVYFTHLIGYGFHPYLTGPSDVYNLDYDISSPRAATWYGDTVDMIEGAGDYMWHFVFNGTYTKTPWKEPNRFMPDTGPRCMGTASFTSSIKDPQPGQSFDIAQLGEGTYYAHLIGDNLLKYSQWSRDLTGTISGNVSSYSITGIANGPDGSQSAGAFPGSINVTIDDYDPVLDVTPVEVSVTFNHDPAEYAVYKKSEPGVIRWPMYRFGSWQTPFVRRERDRGVLEWTYYRGLIYDPPTEEEMIELTVRDDGGIWDYRLTCLPIRMKTWYITFS